LLEQGKTRGVVVLDTDGYIIAATGGNYWSGSPVELSSLATATAQRVHLSAKLWYGAPLVSKKQTAPITVTQDGEFIVGVTGGDSDAADEVAALVSTYGVKHSTLAKQKLEHFE